MPNDNVNVTDRDRVKVENRGEVHVKVGVQFLKWELRCNLSLSLR